MFRVGSTYVQMGLGLWDGVNIVLKCRAREQKRGQGDLIDIWTLGPKALIVYFYVLRDLKTIIINS